MTWTPRRPPARLTVANKVYRGISGAKLPNEFWEPNEYGVRGGVEPAFMSTTLERNVAMGYATRAPASIAGIVIEVQQGMVNRGAELGWLSQYPHECEIVSSLSLSCPAPMNARAVARGSVCGRRLCN